MVHVPSTQAHYNPELVLSEEDHQGSMQKHSPEDVAVEGSAYIHQLASYVRQHEAALANHGQNHQRRPPSAARSSSYSSQAAKNGTTPYQSGTASPSWTTILTLGVLGEDQNPIPRPTPSRVAGLRESPSSVKEPMVLRLDPHHLYYMLLKFDELLNGGGGGGIGKRGSTTGTGIGDLDVKILGGTTVPMMATKFDNHSNDKSFSPISKGPSRDRPGMSRGASNKYRAQKDISDTRSIATAFSSSISTFSLGAGWWNSASNPPPNSMVTEKNDVQYLYSSCTKLPALRLRPSSFSSTMQSVSSSNPNSPNSSSSSPSSSSTWFSYGSPKTMAILNSPIQGFQDCPPPATAIPLYAFKNLQALHFEDLDPRGFLGWDSLSMQLRSLEVKRSGMEDLGELVCDLCVEDARRSEHKWQQQQQKQQQLQQQQQQQRQNKKNGINTSDEAEDEGGKNLNNEATIGTLPTFSEPLGTERKKRQMRTHDDSPILAAQETVLQSSQYDEEGYPIPPRAAWTRLVHLSIAENSLTFVPSEPLSYLSNLTSLDLSSNLLISIPDGLSQLHQLRSLNLKDNMIDSLLGVAKSLGNVQVINLSGNRLENLSGLDRLLSLERIDLRENRIYESLEVSGRLARLPVLESIWLQGNQFAKPKEQGGEENWRVKVFKSFARERKFSLGLKIDGVEPTTSERRTFESELAASKGSRDSRNEISSSPKPVLKGEETTISTRLVNIPSLVPSSLTRGDERNDNLGKHGSEADATAAKRVVSKGKQRRRPANTTLHPASLIVPSSNSKQYIQSSTPTPPNEPQPSSPSTQHLSVNRGQSQIQAQGRKRKPQRIVDLDDATGSKSDENYYSSDTATSNSNSSPGIQAVQSSQALKEVRRTLQQATIEESTGTEPIDGEQEGNVIASLNSPFLGDQSYRGTPRNRKGSSNHDEPSANAVKINEGEAFRRRIEALRLEVGDNWLSVLGEREERERNRKKAEIERAPSNQANNT